jgi:GSH-dependent disulfide-bond oxidoreductase
VFESGAILLYLAEKTGRFLPTNVRGRKTVTEWLFWQVGGLGPMAGQNHHFGIYAPEKLPYAINRYVNETNRLYGVIDRRLADRAFLAGENYTIADMAVYPWIVSWKRQQQELDNFPHLRRWFEAIRERPATLRAYAKGEPYSSRPAVTEEGKKILFGQTAATVAKGETKRSNFSGSLDGESTGVLQFPVVTPPPRGAPRRVTLKSIRRRFGALRSCRWPSRDVPE